MNCINCNKETSGSLGGKNICPSCNCGTSPYSPKVIPFFGNEPPKCGCCGSNMPWAGPDMPWMSDGIWSCKKCNWSPINSLPVAKEQTQDKEEGSKMITNLNEEKEVLKIIDEIETCGCNCDVMNGYTCGIHDLVKQLREKVRVPRCNDVDKFYIDQK